MSSQMKDRIEVFRDVLEKTIYSTMSCATISSSGVIRDPFVWEGRLMIATGALSGPGNRREVDACEVIPIEAYTGELKPLEYSDHWDAVNRGEREREYNGMLVKHGTKQVVLGQEVVFVARDDVQQRGLFD